LNHCLSFSPTPGPTCQSLPAPWARASAAPSASPGLPCPPIRRPRGGARRRPLACPAWPPGASPPASPRLPLPRSPFRTAAPSPSSAQTLAAAPFPSEPLAAAIYRRRFTSAQFPAREAPPPSPRPIQALPGLPPSPPEPPDACPRPPPPLSAVPPSVAPPRSSALRVSASSMLCCPRALPVGVRAPRLQSRAGRRAVARAFACGPRHGAPWPRPRRVKAMAGLDSAPFPPGPPVGADRCRPGWP
jgi:hypothetical protein